MILLPRDRRGRWLPLNPDPFDPRFALSMEEPLGVRRIWLDMRTETCALVDAEDYDWLIRWRWSLHSDGATKLYARRIEAGRRIYMHREIAKRVLGRPPSRRHVLVDHINGDGLLNIRRNLRWATPAKNRRNYYGIDALQADLFSGGAG